MKSKMNKTFFSSFGASLKMLRSKDFLIDLPLASLNIIGRKGASVSREGAVSQARLICEDYIHDKLDNFGLLRKQLNLNSNKKSQVSLAVIAIGAELERRHPKVYRDISRKLNMTMCDENAVDKTLTKVLEHLFDEDTSWAKVISMFALAGQFAVECVQQGHPEFVKVVLDSVGLFVSHHLADWVVAQGGWTQVIPAFRRRKESGALKVFTVVGTFVGLVATVVATVRIR